MLCVTNTTVSRSRRPQRQQLAVEPLPGEFVERAERLVHQQQIAARVTSARAIDTRICMPPDSSRGSWSANGASARPRKRVARPRIGSARAARPRGRAAGARCAATRAHGISVGDWNTKPMRRPAPPVARSRSPHQRSVPAVGATSPAIRLQQRRLAATRRTEQRQEFAAANVEIDAARARACRSRRSCRRRDARRSAALGAGTTVAALRAVTLHVLDEIERVRASRSRRPASRCPAEREELDRRLPARVRHRQQADVRASPPVDDRRTRASCARRRRAASSPICGIVLLDERVAGRRIGEIALPAFGGRAHESRAARRRARASVVRVTTSTSEYGG